MGRHRWFRNLGGHYEAPEPLDRTGPATCYPNRSGAFPADSPHTGADQPPAADADVPARAPRNRSSRHRGDR